MNRENWFSVLAALFDMHVGHSNVDEDAWLEDFQAGLSPYDAFYNEYPEYEGLED